ncbi:hypothetical protein DFQ03_1283 [Maribacter caenipelagi]|uniref:Uncharacterized protein n=1 Tax=Maribacter caenipelagi TaxID=1447781 RepID=A0A4R7DCD0_9FLAO|nr:hypothetical protein DFQ03_1283 [Maribacter caenipelagi]
MSVYFTDVAICCDFVKKLYQKHNALNFKRLYNFLIVKELVRVILMLPYV